MRGYYVKLRLLLSTLCLFLVAGTAAAHHSFAMFDRDHQILLSGKVTRFEWQNPHVYIHLEARDAAGKTSDWLIECANPGILNRVGWKFNIIKENDQIAVVVSPLRTGEPGALLQQVRLADGRIMENGGPAGPPKISIVDGKPLPDAKPTATDGTPP
jgi:Family of unknown function (DUF6152)